jgi:hypothetical protein
MPKLEVGRKHMFGAALRQHDLQNLSFHDRVAPCNSIIMANDATALLHFLLVTAVSV